MVRTGFMVSFLCLSLAGASCGEDGASDTVDAAPQGTIDGAVGQPDASNPGNLDVAYSGYLRLINQEVFREGDVFAAGGTGRFYLFAPEALPPDNRQRFPTGDGENCTLEDGTEWPTLPAPMVEWPAGTLLSAGDLTFDVTDGPNDVVFEHFGGNYLRKAPAAVMQGDITHSSFFDSSNLPGGKAITMTAQGGPGVGSFQFSTTLPEDYTVSAPDLETGNDVIDVTQPMQFTWTPSQSGARMEVIVKKASSFSFLRCSFADDGSAQVPLAAMAALNFSQFSDVVIQTLRQVSHKEIVEESGGKGVEIDFIAEHVQIGRFDTTGG